MPRQDCGAWPLDRTECLSLMASVPFGRIVFTDGALPAITPVNFVLDHSGIVIRTRSESRVASAVPGGVVAFQADDIDVPHRTGWTVTVVGQARRITEPLELERLARLPLQPWVGPGLDVLVAVSLGLVTGRRIGGSLFPAPGQRTGLVRE